MKRPPFCFAAIALLASASLFGTAALPQSSDRAGQAAPKTIEELQLEAQKILTRAHIPGAGIALVAKDRVIWAGGVGKADIAGNTIVTADTSFRAGSISKSFVALALLKLQEEGRIDLNAKLADLAPEIPVQSAWESAQPITVANLLEHTAGFDDMHVSGTYNVSDPPGMPLLDILKKFSSPLTSRWIPSSRFSYSNPDYGIAGYLIEKITHEPYDQYIRENILIPLGMVNSDFRLTNLNQPLLAKGYDGSSRRPVPYVEIYLRPAGDLKTSPKELAQFVQLLLNRGKLGDTELLKPESLDRMEYPQTTQAARAGLKYGYGLANYTDLEGPVVAHGHNGGIAGFISTYKYLPDRGLGWVILLNSSTPGQGFKEMESLVRNFLLAGQPVPEKPQMILSGADLDRFAGYYEKRNPSNELFDFLDLLLSGRRVFEEYGTLYQRGIFGPKQVLVPVTANQFREEKEAAASRIFFTDDSGAMIYVDQGFYGVRVSPLWPWTRLGLVLLGLALMASSLAFALVWIPRRLMGRMRGVERLSVRGVPLLAALSLLAAFLVLDLAPDWMLGVFDILSFSVCLLTWAFAALSLWGLWLALRSFKWDVKPAVRIYSLLVSIACCGIAAYLGYWHLIGLRLWAP
jgi:CubicO group peptidase (beta-lactamase class C family)